MKKYLFFLLMSGLIISCEKDDVASWSLALDSEDHSINEILNDINYKFYLLNEDGEIANVFSEGENFSMHFSVVNNSSISYSFIPRFAIQVNTFFHVFNANDEDLGRSFDTGYTNAVGIGGFPFEPSDEVVFEVPWQFPSDTSWSQYFTSYSSNYKPLLEKGEYYTEFESKFEFYKDGNTNDIYTQQLKFKINFKIE